MIVHMIIDGGYNGYLCEVMEWWCETALVHIYISNAEVLKVEIPREFLEEFPIQHLVQVYNALSHKRAK